MKSGEQVNLKNLFMKYRINRGPLNIKKPEKAIISEIFLKEFLLRGSPGNEEKKFVETVLSICESSFSQAPDIKYRLLKKTVESIKKKSINNFEIAVANLALDFYRDLENEFRMKFIIRLLKEIETQSEIAIYKEIINREIGAIERWREPEIGYLALKEILTLEELCLI